MAVTYDSLKLLVNLVTESLAALTLMFLDPVVESLVIVRCERYSGTSSRAS